MITTAKLVARGVKPAANTDTLLYTVPTAKQAEINLFICNQSAAAETARVSLTPSGLAAGAEDVILQDTQIAANGGLQITGIALGAGDFITVRSSGGNISFVPTGLEVG